MTRPPSTLFILLLLLTLWSADIDRCRAQEPASRIELGPALRGGVGLQNGRFPVYFGDQCGFFDGASTFGGAVGAGFDFRPTEGSSWSIWGSLGYELRRTRYTTTPSAEQLLFDPATRELLRMDREFRFDGNVRGITLDAEFRAHPFEALEFGLGGAISGTVSSTYRQTDNVVAPTDRSFSDGERIHEMSPGVAVAGSPLVFTGLATVAVSFPVGEGRRLVGSVGLRADITSTVSQESWRNIGLSGGIALLFSSPPQPPPPPPPPPLPPPPPPELSVSVAIYGVDEQGEASPEALITVREIFFRDNIPLLPTIYFDSGSATIASRYDKLTPQGANAFTWYDVATRGAFGLSHGILNVIGQRLRDDPAARIYIYPTSTNESQRVGVADERARTVRDYLTGVWGIPSKRVEIRPAPGPMAPSSEGTADGEAENRRIVLASNSPELLGPLVTERIVRDFNPPRIGITPSFSAEAGVKSWSLTVWQKGVELVRQRSTDSIGASGSQLTWRLLDDQIDSGLAPLKVVLEVEDSAGQRRTATDSLQLRLRRDSSYVESGHTRRGEIDRIAHTLVAFDFRSAIGTRRHDQVIRSLSDEIRSGATVTVTGFTDRIGDDKSNIELSRQRAEYVAERIRQRLAERGIESVTIRAVGVGVDTTRYPNAFPEGRVLTRGATVVVEQKAAGSGGKP